MVDLPPLTPEQLAALRIIGPRSRYWRQQVRQLWEQGMPLGLPVVTSDPLAIVYALRNTHGPAWLRRFQLYPKGEA